MNLQPRAIILVAIDAFGGQVGGKTLLQKRLYFTEILLGESLGLDFDAHYYGPYSANVNSELATLKVQGLLREDSATYGYSPGSGFEMRRYSYELTQDGKTSVAWLRNNYRDECERVIAAAKRVLDAGDLDYMDLSFAAKAHWVLRSCSKAMSDSDVAREATRFGWKVEPDQMRKGVQFLFKTHLARPTQEVAAP